MDIVLIILGILGFGAIVIAAYVFTVAARNYVSDEEEQQAMAGQLRREGPVTRNVTDRRSGIPVQFPLNVNGVVITRDRRHTPERRAAA